MNILKTSQLPLVEFLRYIKEGNEHHAYIMERKKSNYKNDEKWVTATSPRPATFAVKPKPEIEKTNVTVNS